MIKIKLIDGSVKKISTTTLTADENGLTVDKGDNSKTKTNIDADGLEILDKTGSSEEVLLEAKYDEYFELLCSVEIMSDNKLFEYYRKEKAKLEKVVSAFKEYKNKSEEFLLSKELADTETDEKQRQAYLSSSANLEKETNELFERVKEIYFDEGSKEVQKTKIEISQKQGNGGLVLELKDLVLNYASLNKFETEVISETDSQISLFVVGENSFEVLKSIGGTIRKIENTNEVTALVVVLLDSEKEIELREEDIAIEISKSSGAGGQHINKTESAVKLIHLSTGITAECQDERSQGKNKEKAMAALKEKILQKSKENREKNIKNQRNSLKTAIFADTPVLIFDFDRNKVVDNRTKKNYGLKEILSGNLNIISSDLRV